MKKKPWPGSNSGVCFYELVIVDLEGALLKEEGDPRVRWDCDAPEEKFYFDCLFTKKFGRHWP